MAADSDCLLVRDAEGIAVVTLNRPAARNALDAELRQTLYRWMQTLDAQESVRAVVLTGADPAFCAGLDLKELAGAPETLTGAPETRGGGSGARADTELRRPIPAMTTPVIAAVNGVAITGGFELALACDFIVASERARFADTHARVGIMPGWGLTVNLAESIGIRRAREVSATGNFVDAVTAHQWGLVNHVVPHDQLLELACELATDIAGNDPDGVRHVLTTYQLGAALGRDDALALEAKRSSEWLAGRSGVAGADLEARRRAVTERGRDQHQERRSPP